MEPTKMRTSISRYLTTALVAAGIAAVLGASPARADEWKKSYPISGHANLTVNTGDGDVFVTGGDQRTVDATVTADGYKIGPNDLQVVESQNGDQVTIDLKFPHMGWHWGGHNKVRIDLRVPRDLDLEVKTGDGNVTASNVSGKLQFQSGDGNVSASNIRGDIHMHTGDGRIDGHGFDGSLDAFTGDGSMKVEGRFDSLALKTGDGSIDAQAGSGSKIANSWNVHSGDGSITLRLASDFNANLEAHTGDGNITLDIPIQVSGSLNRSSVHGKLNAGGGTLSVSSGDGSIRLEKL
jgi:Putative adhesin